MNYFKGSLTQMVIHYRLLQLLPIMEPQFTTLTALALSLLMMISLGRLISLITSSIKMVALQLLLSLSILMLPPNNILLLIQQVISLQFLIRITTVMLAMLKVIQLLSPTGVENKLIPTCGDETGSYWQQKMLTALTLLSGNLSIDWEVTQILTG